jgi:hypothetical protein
VEEKIEDRSIANEGRRRLVGAAATVVVVEAGRPELVYGASREVIVQMREDWRGGTRRERAG